MRGVGEHVDGLDAPHAVARCDGERQLAGERLGVAGDEDAASGLQPAEDLADDVRRAALARRVEDDGVEGPGREARERLLDRRAHELQPVLSHAVLAPVELGVPRRLAVALDGGDRVAAEGDRQGEEAAPAVEVEDAEPLLPRQRFDDEPHEGRRRVHVRLEEGRRRHEEGRAERLLPDVPGTRHPLRLASHEEGARPVVEVEDEAVRLLGPLEERAERRLEGRVVAGRHEHRHGFPLVAARAHDDVADEALRADPGRGDARRGEGVPQGERDPVGAPGVDRALLDRHHVVRSPREVPHHEAARPAAEDEGGLLTEAPRHAVRAGRHPDRGRDARRGLAHRAAQQDVEGGALPPELLRVGDVLPAAAAAGGGVPAARGDAVGRRLLDGDDLGERPPREGAHAPDADALARDPAGHDEALCAVGGERGPRPVQARQRDDGLAAHASVFRSICRACPSRWAA